MLMIIEQVKKFFSSFGTQMFISLLHYSKSVLVKSENHRSFVTSCRSCLHCILLNLFQKELLITS
jgi:hypothetical protein